MLWCFQKLIIHKKKVLDDSDRIMRKYGTLPKILPRSSQSAEGWPLGTALSEGAELSEGTSEGRSDGVTDGTPDRLGAEVEPLPLPGDLVIPLPGDLVIPLPGDFVPFPCNDSKTAEFE